MRFLSVMILALAAAYYADVLLFGGIHAETAILLAGYIVRAIRQGLSHFA